MTNCKRMMVTIKPEMEKNMEKLKKKKYYNTSNSEMLRHLLDLGMEIEMPSNVKKKEK